MPSWNIHTAHVEALLKTHEPSQLGISDIDSFLFGNLLPDLYVGYMVPTASKRIDYHTTHLASPQFMPEPDAEKFWRLYLYKYTSVPIRTTSAQTNATSMPSSANTVHHMAGAQHGHDLLLGAWAHLLCDRYYNRFARKVAINAGYTPSDTVRILKQTDFDQFGKSLAISLTPQPTAELFTQAATFPQYEVEKNDVIAALSVQKEIIALNQESRCTKHVPYRLLSEEFFQNTFAYCNDCIATRLKAFAASEPFDFYD